MSAIAVAASAVRRIFALRRTAADRYLSTERVIPLGPSTLGVWMTPEEALRLSAVWACVSVISKSMAASNWDVFQEGADGNRESLPRSFGIWRLLNLRPNPEMSAFAFKEAMYIQALIVGNFFAEIERDLAGRPVALWPLAHERCSLERDKATKRLVLVVQNQDRGESILDYDDVFHLHGPSVDGIAGFDVVNLAARSLAQFAAVERFGLSFYSNGTSFGGILKSKAPNLSEPKVKELRDQIEARHKGSDRAFKFLLLSADLDYTALAIKPEEAQYVEGKIQLIQDVCRWFGVPPHKIAELSRSTFSNIEHQGLEFVRDALTPWAERAAQECDWKLLLSNSVGSRIELEWLAEGDAKSKAETDSILVQNGLLRRNEARRRRGQNSIGPDGDRLTVQSNLILLENVGKIVPKSAGGTPTEKPNDDEPTPAERDAARAIFAGTMRQAYERLAARRDAPNAMRDHAHYVGSQIGVALGVLDRAGVRFDEHELKAALAAHMETDAALDTIDAPARAAEVADTLASLIRKD